MDVSAPCAEFLGEDDDDFTVVEELGDRGYLTVLSDIDSKDWETSLSVEQMLANGTPAAGTGGTILFHDAGGVRAKTVQVLEQLAPKLQARATASPRWARPSASPRPPPLRAPRTTCAARSSWPPRRCRRASSAC